MVKLNVQEQKDITQYRDNKHQVFLNAHLHELTQLPIGPMRPMTYMVKKPLNKCIGTTPEVQLHR